MLSVCSIYDKQFGRFSDVTSNKMYYWDFVMVFLTELKGTYKKHDPHRMAYGVLLPRKLNYSPNYLWYYLLHHSIILLVSRKSLL